jgi:hypothetical protein
MDEVNAQTQVCKHKTAGEVVGHGGMNPFHRYADFYLATKGTVSAPSGMW